MAEYSWKTLMEPKHENCNLSIKSWDLLECWWSYSVGNITNCVQFECGCVCKQLSKLLTNASQMFVKAWCQKKMLISATIQFCLDMLKLQHQRGFNIFQQKTMVEQVEQVKTSSRPCPKQPGPWPEKQSWNECSNEYVKNRPTIQMIQNDSSEQFRTVQQNPASDPKSDQISDDFLHKSWTNLGKTWENPWEKPQIPWKNAAEMTSAACWSSRRWPDWPWPRWSWEIHEMIWIHIENWY